MKKKRRKKKKSAAEEYARIVPDASRFNRDNILDTDVFPPLIVINADAPGIIFFSQFMQRVLHTSWDMNRVVGANIIVIYWRRNLPWCNVASYDFCRVQAGRSHGTRWRPLSTLAHQRRYRVSDSLEKPWFIMVRLARSLAFHGLPHLWTFHCAILLRSLGITTVYARVQFRLSRRDIEIKY